MGIGGSCDLHRLPDPVPHRIDDRDIHSLLAEVRQEFAQSEQGFARADRMRALPANMRTACLRLKHALFTGVRYFNESPYYTDIITGH
jgi:hypothetical protein